MIATLQSVLETYSDLPEFDGHSIAGVNMRGSWGNMPLHIAAVRGNSEEASILIAAGADVNARGEHGYTPLHEAAEQGHLEMVELLLSHQASPLARNDDGQTPRELWDLLNDPQPAVNL